MRALVSVSGLCFVVLAVRVAIFHNECAGRRYMVAPVLYLDGDVGS